MDKSVCIICNKADDKPICEIKKTAFNPLVEISILFMLDMKRIDNKYKKIENMTSAFIHRTCQTTYNKETAIAAFCSSRSRKSKESKENKNALRFNFHSHCFLWGESYGNISKEKNSSVKSNDTRDNILQYIH